MKGAKLFFVLTLVSINFLATSCYFHFTRSKNNSSDSQYYLLSYYPNGAQGDIYEEEILSGEKFTIKDNFYDAPEDLKFAFWNTRRDGRGTSYTAGETISMPCHDLYLFAHWISCDSYSIVYKNCEDADNTANPGEFTKTEDITLSPASKTGYIFNGWYLTPDFSDEGITSWLAGEKNKTLSIYAKWTPETRSVTYKAGNSSESEYSLEVNYDDTITLSDCLFEAPKNKKFSYWSIDGENYSAGETFGPVKNNLEIKAVFEYFARGDVSRKNIQINDKIFENTAEVCVVPPASSAKITGSDDVWSSYIWNEDHNDFKGAFIENRTVSLSPYAVSKYMVTKELFTAVFGRLPTSDSKDLDDSEISDFVAVGGINFYAGIAFCNKLTLLTGGTTEDLAYSIEGVDWENLTYSDIPTSKNVVWNNVVCDLSKPGYRLLTEAEWEFAARGGNTNSPEFNYAYPGFNTAKPITLGYSLEEGTELNLIDEGYEYCISSKSILNNWSRIADEATIEYAWLNLSGNNKVHQTGLLKPNSLGIYDMAGNLWEWLWDYYSDSPTDADNLYTNEENVVVNPMGPETGSYRMRKGCNFMEEWGLAVKATSGYRGERMEEQKTGANYGLRIGRSLVD